MALIKCPECGKEISDKAEKCPNCGHPVIQAEENEEELYDENETYGIISLVIGILGIIIAFVINRGILLILPAVVFISSICLSRKCYRWFSSLGFGISSLGLVLIIFEFVKPIIFSILSHM